MGRSTEDWQSYRLGERIIHTPAVHGAGWQALAGEGMTAVAAATADGDAGAASVSEVFQDVEAEPLIRAKTLMERLIARLPNCRQTPAGCRHSSKGTPPVGRGSVSARSGRWVRVR